MRYVLMDIQFGWIVLTITRMTQDHLSSVLQSVVIIT